MITNPQRTEEHRTDTLAMKKVSLALGQDLLLRSIDERDYGVDALVERYDSGGAGQLLVFQVKGTRDAIKVGKNGISLGGFPRRTVLYAEEFVHPFIVAFTSVEKGVNDTSPIYYLWLQRYVEYFLEGNEPGWRSDSQKTMTLYLPAKNQVSTDLNRICKIAESSMLQKQAHRIIVATARLQAIAKDAPEISFINELNWIVAAIERSPMITVRTDDPCAPLRDILENVRKTSSAALKLHQKSPIPTAVGKAKTTAKKKAEADQKLVVAVGILERRMNGVLAEVLVMDTQPSANSW